MHPRAAITVFRSAVRAARELDATIPKAFAAEIDNILDLDRRAVEFTADLRGITSTSNAVLDALAAGKDPLTDPTVKAITTRQLLAGSVQGIINAATDRTAAFVNERGPDLLACFTAPFDQAAAAVTNAVEVLGDIDLEDTTSVARKGGRAGKAWAEAKTGELTINTIATTWSQLSMVSKSIPQIDVRYRLLVIADVPPNEWVKTIQPQARTEPSAWFAARRGWPLSFPTVDAYRERIDAIRAEREEQARRRDLAHSEAFRRQHGIGRTPNVRAGAGAGAVPTGKDAA